ncbi:MAG: formylglycine-generating enzyme family protein [Treponema sp.]|jgi:formylglycine-generating enzyme required for sulfatase activity|nr:formylglycine-generating enzyme family protein [Treponema sp.]
MKKSGILLCIFFALLLAACNDFMGLDLTDKPVSALDLTGLVTAPVKDQEPDTTTINHSQYLGAVVWKTEDSLFQSAAAYTVEVSLLPKKGFTFFGVAENVFSYTGAFVTNPAGIDPIMVVSIAFPATDGETASALDLTDLVTVPLTGETPQDALTDHPDPEYTGTIVWSPDPENNFKHDTVYTAEITLTAKFGFAFTGVEADSFIHNGAITVTNPVGTGNTITITIMFPPTTSTTHDPGIGDTKTMGGVPFNLRYVPSGYFQRDSGKANISVITKGYWMGETEVTQELWEAVMGAGNKPSYHTANPEDSSANGWKKLPVEQVSWYDIIAFCNKLSILDSPAKIPVYSLDGFNEADWENLDYEDISDLDWSTLKLIPEATGYRLPTEMEWMWAAMGASKGGTDVHTKGYLKGYAGRNKEPLDSQDEIVNFAWCFKNADKKTHQVSSESDHTMKSNELGLYDMSGNVFEWCWDWTAAYPEGIESDYKGAGSGQKRSLRGGSFRYEKGCAVASRLEAEPYLNGGDNIGFRIVCAE